MNLPNKLTILRIILIPVFVALLSVQTPMMQLLAMVVFALASFTDFLDGFIARKNNLVTDFGKLMDPMADKLLVMAALVGLVAQGRAHYICAMILLAREFVIMSVRLVAANKGIVISADMLGKIKTVVQLIAILCILPTFDIINQIGYWLLWASAAISVWSCVSYIIRNKEVFGE